MMLLERLQILMAVWSGVFRQQRTFLRARGLLLGLLCALGRRTMTKSLAFWGRTQCDWSADYRVFSRSPWNVEELFTGVLNAALRHVPNSGFVAVSLDDTSLKKSSRVITAARWLRDALSPAFHVNLKYGLRCLHAAIVLPYYGDGYSGRAVSVGFELAPPVRKPGRKADAAQVAEYKHLAKIHNLSTRAVGLVGSLRAGLDRAGCAARTLLMVVDGGYTNRTVLSGLPDRVDLIGRTRKDIALCRPAPKGGRRVYGERLPTPEQVRQDPSRPYQVVTCHYGGKDRPVRYKEVSGVLWRTAAQRRVLRLLVVAPTPYKAPGKGRKLDYHDPAYLITTDLDSSVRDLLQAYFDRWQIEPLHRDLKTGLGLGQAQAWADDSVARIHSAVVAAYSMLVLAAIDVYGPERTAAFPPLPAWRRRKPTRRHSQNDLIAVLRNDIQAATHTPVMKPPDEPPDWRLPPRETYAYA